MLEVAEQVRRAAQRGAQALDLRIGAWVERRLLNGHYEGIGEVEGGS